MGDINKRVFHFSGGKSSALMVLSNYRKGDLVIFTDTGREYKKTYDFIDDFEKFENIPVIRLQYKGGWRELLRKKKAIPNRFMRFCTIELKIKTTRRYLRSIGYKNYTQFVGFRADEQNRVKGYSEKWKGVETKFPLNDAGISKLDVLKFWESKPYTLDMPSILGNCTLCFQKGKAAILTILHDYPELAAEWIEDEKIIGNTYFKGVSMETLLKMSKSIKQYDLFEVQPEFNCACTSI
jgi:hypothetical protein